MESSTKMIQIAIQRTIRKTIHHNTPQKRRPMTLKNKRILEILKKRLMLIQVLTMMDFLLLKLINLKNNLEKNRENRTKKKIKIWT